MCPAAAATCSGDRWVDCVTQLTLAPIQHNVYTVAENEQDSFSNAQYTPPTRRNCFVASASAVWTQSQLAHNDCRRIRSTIWKLTRLHSIWLHQFWEILISFSTMTSLCRHCWKVINISQTSMESVWPVFKFRQSSWASCKLCCSHRRRDATRQFRRVGVGGVYWA